MQPHMKCFLEQEKQDTNSRLLKKLQISKATKSSKQDNKKTPRKKIESNKKQAYYRLHGD